MINIKNLDPNKIRIDKKSNKIVLIYYIRFTKLKNLSYIKLNSLNSLNEHTEEGNGNKYLTLGPTDKSKEILKRYEKLRNKSEI